MRFKSHQSHHAFAVLLCNCMYATRLTLLLSCSFRIVIPLVTAYLDNGGFDWRQKTLSSLAQNAVFYFVAIAIYVVCVVYMRAIEKRSWSDINGLTMALSNVYGLVLLVVLAGWGLVSVPRQLWQDSHPQRRLDYCYFRAAKLSHERDECKDLFYATLTLLQTLPARIRAEARSDQVELFLSYHQVIVAEMSENEANMAHLHASTHAHPVHDNKTLNAVKRSIDTH